MKNQTPTLYLVNLTYLTSIVYVPIEIANNAVTNRLFPIVSLIIIIISLSKTITVKDLKKFAPFFAMAFSFIVSIGSFVSLIYTFVFLSLIFFVIPYYVLLRRHGESFLNQHVRFIVFMAILSVLIGWVEFFYPTIVEELFFLRGSIYSVKSQVSSLYSNPNVFGHVVALSFQAGLLLYKKNTFKILILFVILLSGTILSGSRMAIAIIIFMLILRIIPLIKIKTNYLVIPTTIFLFYISLNFEFFGEFIYLNLRDVIWTGALDVFLLHPFFGIGLGQFQIEVSYYVSGYEDQSANNMFIGLLCETGLIGTLLFFIAILRPVITLRKVRNGHTAYQSSLMILFLFVSQYSEYMLLYVAPYVLVLTLFVASAQWSKG